MTIGDELLDALCFAARWTYRLVFVIGVMILAGCYVTGCTITGNNYYRYEIAGINNHTVPVDKSTTGATTSTQTVSPKTSVTGLPGM